MAHELDFNHAYAPVAEGDTEDQLQELMALIYGERR